MRFNSRRSTVLATNGMVATSQPLAAMAGLRMLMNGGSAVDAAVAAAATLNVVEPQATGAGGDLFALVYNASDKKVYSLNASGHSPAAASAEELRNKGMRSIPDNSPYSVTVPGAVSGWQALLDRFGKMSMSEVLKPAIAYATGGYPVSEVISMQWQGAAAKLEASPSGSELLLNGRAPRPGEFLKLPELSKTLNAIAEGGAEAFYKGPLATRTAEYVQGLGGWLSAEDMAGHSADWVDPISTDYRGVTCWQCPPNNQGVNVLMALNMAEGFDLAGTGFQESETFHHLIECVRLAMTDGMHYVTDPSKMSVETSRLISKSYAEERRKLIHRNVAISDLPLGDPGMRSDTVYITAVDGEGNACSLINSVYSSFGSGLVVPGTGMALQSRGTSFSLDPEHPNVLEPNKRPYHTLIPGMATKGDELWLSYGVMGTVQQAQGHLQILVNMIDFGLDPQEALNAPRFSYRPAEGVIGLESMVSGMVAYELRSKGHKMELREPHPLYFGGGQIIERDAETGVLKGGSEPRNDGCAVGW